MDPLNLKKLNAARRQRRAIAHIVNLTDGRDRVVEEGQEVAGALGEALETGFRTGRSARLEADGAQFFVNVHLPPPRLVVIGAVHISQALVPIAAAAGYAMEVIDPRTAFATPERFAQVPLSAEWPEDALRENPLDAYCALAALTHDPKIDDYPLRAALEAGCFYVGALGSRKTHTKRIERLASEGVDEAALQRIHAPIGLDIAAASPAEIAIAVMAEVIGAFRRRGLASVSS